MQPSNTPSQNPSGPARATGWLSSRSRPMQIGLGCGALIVLCICGAIVLAVANSGGKTSAGGGSPTSTTAANHTAGPKATATSGPKPKVVLHESGNGAKQTQTFTISGSSWKVDLKCSGVTSGLGSAPVFITATRTDGGFSTDNLNYSCPEGAGGSSSSTFHDQGKFYLDINSGIDWEVTVTDIP